MSREWYPWFPHRFWSSERVALMDDAAVALYKFLLDHEWENGPFSADERVIRAICSRFKSFDSSWPQVKGCFTLVGTRYQNERMEMERGLEREAADARAQRSKNSWTKRRASAEHAHSTRTAHAEHVESTHTATDGRTNGQTDGQTDIPTSQQAVRDAQAPAPPARKPRARSAPSSNHAILIEWWCQRYLETQGDRYIVQGGKDGAAVKRLLATRTLEEVQDRAERLLGCLDAFHAGNRTLSWLESRWNEIGQLDKPGPRKTALQSTLTNLERTLNDMADGKVDIPWIKAPKRKALPQ